MMRQSNRMPRGEQLPPRVLNAVMDTGGATTPILPEYSNTSELRYAIETSIEISVQMFG